MISENEDIIPGIDTVEYQGETWYTTSGAMKATHLKKNSFYKEVRDGLLEVFPHPSGNLFSRATVQGYRFKKMQQKKELKKPVN